MRQGKKWPKWDEARSRYITEFKSIRELARAYKGEISETRLYEVASKEGWAKLRKEFLDKLDEDFRERMAGKILETREKLFNLGQFLIAKGYEKIKSEEAKVDERLAKELIDLGSKLVLQSSGATDTEKKPIDARTWILNLNVPKEQIEEFIKFREKKLKDELSKPKQYYSGSTEREPNRVDTTKQDSK